MRQRLKGYWRAFANIAIVFSFIVNLILVLVLLLAIVPLLQLKSDFVEPLLDDLDLAFQGLGETTIRADVGVEETIPISFTQPMSQPLTLDFMLPINQSTEAVLSTDVRLDNLPATFTFPGGGGEINGTVSLNLPEGQPLPVWLRMEVPVQRTIPVIMDIPVDQDVPIRMVIPVNIKLGEAGLDDAVQDLRDVFAPVNESLDRLPDGIRFR